MVAAVGIPVTVGIIYWGLWPLGILMAVTGALGAREYYGLTPLNRAQDPRPASETVAP